MDASYLLNNARLKIAEGLPVGDMLSVVYMKMVAIAVISNEDGFLMVDKQTPYTENTLRIHLNRSTQHMRYALTGLKENGLIEITEDGFKVIDYKEFLPNDKNIVDQGREKRK